MFKKALALDHKLFLKGKRIQAKRPSEYWLVFLKKYVLVHHKEKRSWAFNLYAIPAIAFGLLLYTTIYTDSIDSDDIMVWFMGCLFFTFFMAVIIAMISSHKKLAFVDPNVFAHLAKFIIKIKGDTFENKIGIKLDLSQIEVLENYIEPASLGLKDTNETTYNPYYLERYQANLRLKDGSFCYVSLHQISVKKTTTKRRSSGKVKSKSKHKHKFYYNVSLKLSAVAYHVVPVENSVQFESAYEISIRTENGFHIVKMKFKEKISAIRPKITAKEKNSPSVFLEMIDFLLERKIIAPKT